MPLIACGHFRRRLRIKESDHININAAGDEYGRGRLAALIRGHCDKTPAHLISEIFSDLDRFATQAFDDQTVFVMKVV